MFTKRETTIIELLKQNNEITVDVVSEKLGVSLVTGRKILDTMSKDGLIRRIHGGAVLIDNETILPGFTKKETLHIEEKKLIAKHATNFVTSEDTIFCNGGTTIMEFIKVINRNNVNQIITNNASAIQCSFHLTNKILFTGGTIDKFFMSFIGDIAINNLQNIFPDNAFLGVVGIDIEKGITAPIIEEAVINKVMINNTRDKVYVITDSSKIGKVSNHFVANINVVDTIITDSKITNPQLEELNRHNINVIIAK